jgi:hypothetical protein
LIVKVSAASGLAGLQNGSVPAWQGVPAAVRVNNLLRRSPIGVFMKTMACEPLSQPLVGAHPKTGSRKESLHGLAVEFAPARTRITDPISGR